MGIPSRAEFSTGASGTSGETWERLECRTPKAQKGQEEDSTLNAGGGAISNVDVDRYIRGGWS
jgi:hypothetical protein